MKIARVFPRCTHATPTDALAYVGLPPLLAMPEVDEVHVSATFTYDLPEAERLAEAWRVSGVSVRLGGPATGQRGDEFTPGMYLREGYTITSRGCPNRCWFCSVPKREGGLRELEIKPGYNILDDNLLGCSETHIRAVFAMLEAQKERTLLTGGLEAKLLRPWHIDLMLRKRPKRMYFAYDTPDDLEPLIAAGHMLRESGISMTTTYCYVLIGYPGDTMAKAERRLIDTVKAGFIPMAMLWKDEAGHEDKSWRRFQGLWARPAIINARLASGEIRLQNEGDDSNT